MTTFSAPVVRRLTTGIALVAAFSAVLAGCSGQSASTDETAQFSLGFPATPNSPYAKLAEMYMAEHPEVTVTTSPIPSDSYDSLLSTQMQAGSGPDVVLAVPGAGSTVALLSLAKAGLLAPLSDEHADLVDPSAQNLFSKDGTRFGQPLDFSVTATVFNTAPHGELAASQTEMLKSCEERSAEGTALFAVAGTIPINTGLMAVVIAASTVYAEAPDWDAERAAGDVTFAGTDGWRDALQLIVDMKAAGCFQPGAEGGNFDAIVGGLGQGTALGAFIPAGAASELAAGIPDATIDVQAFPAKTAGNSFLFASSDYALAINAASDDKSAAQKFLDWLAEPENSAAYAKEAGSLPVSGIENVDLTDTVYADVADLLAAKRYTTLPVNVWTNPDVFLTLGSGVQALLTGQKSVDAVLAELDAAWDR